MKIGIEAQRLFRPKKHGMDIVALELIRSLHESDRENEYHIFVKKDADSSCLNLTQPNFHLHVLPTLPYPVWEQFYLPFYIRKLGLDVLHCTANTAPLFAPCPKIVTLHDIIFLESNPLEKGSMYQRFGNLYRSWIVPLMVKSSQVLITVSYFEQKRIKEHFGFDDKKVRVVYNGVGDHFFYQHTQEEIEKARQKFQLPKKFILFLGNKTPKKNLPNVVRAYDKYVKACDLAWNLVVLDFDKESLREFIEVENLSPALLEKISSLGYVNNKELPVLIQASELFLYPSLRESFGIPILEGMAGGVPVITSNTSSMPEVAGDAAILVDPHSPDEIAQAIIGFQDNPELATELKEKGLQRSKQFSWASACRKSVEIYKEFARS